MFKLIVFKLNVELCSYLTIFPGIIYILKCKVIFFVTVKQDTANLASSVNASGGLMSPSNTLIKEEEVLLAGNRVKVGLIHRNFVTHKFVQMTPACKGFL